MLNQSKQDTKNPENGTNKQNNRKYKTTLCKHFQTPQGCSYGYKCQFAHGNNDLRLNNTQFAPMIKIQNNMLNYKVAKCKNWERDGVCKYGSLCTFAHGDKEVRSKNENLYQIGPFPLMMPFNFDMNSMGMMPNNQDFYNIQQMVPGAMSQNMMGISAPNEKMQNNNENMQGN